MIEYTQEFSEEISPGSQVYIFIFSSFYAFNRLSNLILKGGKVFIRITERDSNNRKVSVLKLFSFFWLDLSNSSSKRFCLNYRKIRVIVIRIGKNQHYSQYLITWRSFIRALENYSSFSSVNSKNSLKFEFLGVNKSLLELGSESDRICTYRSLLNEESLRKIIS